MSKNAKVKKVIMSYPFYRLSFGPLSLHVHLTLSTRTCFCQNLATRDNSQNLIAELLILCKSSPEGSLERSCRALYQKILRKLTGSHDFSCRLHKDLVKACLKELLQGSSQGPYTSFLTGSQSSCHGISRKLFHRISCRILCKLSQDLVQSFCQEMLHKLSDGISCRENAKGSCTSPLERPCRELLMGSCTSPLTESRALAIGSCPQNFTQILHTFSHRIS